MGLKESLSSLLFKDTADAKSGETPVQAPKANQTNQSKQDGYVFSPNPNTPTSTVSTVQTTGVADDKFISMLEAVIAENNLPGLDYYEFKKSIEKMSNLPMDEKTKFLWRYYLLDSSRNRFL